MSIFYIFCNYYYHYHRQGNRLVGSNILEICLATELPCTFLDVRANRDCKPHIYLGNSPEYLIIKFIQLKGCVILPMSYRVYRIIETGL